MVTPPYVRPTQPGLLAHYRAVADDDALPIVLYNVPGRTGCDMLPGTVAALASHPRIVGIKEARIEPERMQALLAIGSNDFTVLSGDDPTACRAMLAGCDGVVSVASNALPASFRRLCDLARAGNRGEAESWNAQLVAVCEFLGVESNPIPIKALLSRLGIGHGLRLPLLPLSAEHEGAAATIARRVLELEQDFHDAFVA